MNDRTDHTNPSHTTGDAPLPVLWTAAQPAVAAFIRSIVPSFHDAQDLLQQTAVVVFRKFDSYDRAQPFVAWAIGIARLEAMQRRRTLARDRHVFAGEQIERIADAFVEIRHELDPMSEALSGCMRSIDGRGRELLELRYRGELSAKAIGERVGMKESAVFVALHRVRDALRRCIERRLAEEAEA